MKQSVVKAWLVSLIIVFSSQVVLAQEPITIEYWHTNTETFGLPALRELITAFEAKHPDIKIVERTNDGYTPLLQNLQTALAAGNPPDVTQIGYLFRDYVHANFPYVPITTLAEKYNGSEHLSKFADNVLALGQVAGDQVGMPYSLSNIVVYYNEDVLRQAGLDPANPPQTWQAWREAAEAIRDNAGIATPLYLHIVEDNWSLEALIASNGGQLLTCENGVYQAGFNTPEAAEALQLQADLIKDGLMLNAPMDQGEQAFLAGQVAVLMSTVAKRASLEASATFALGGTTFPSFGDKPTRLPGGGNILSVFSQDEVKQKAAWTFVEFLTSAEGFTIWSRGTGYVPLLPEVAESPEYLGDFIAEHPIQGVGVAQLPNVIPWTSFPGTNGLAAGQALFAARQQALAGQATAQDALATTAQEVNSAIGSESCEVVTQ